MKFQKEKIIWGMLGAFAMFLVVSAFQLTILNQEEPADESPVALFQMPGLAQTASNNGMYLELDGQVQGRIPGSCTEAGREGTIVVYALQHGVEIPRDTHTGLPTGQRIHKPLVVTKEIDRASPLLYQACVTGERSEVTLSFYRDNERGQEELYYTINLVEAIIVEIRADVPDIRDPANDVYGHMEHVSFTYSKIIWSHKVDNIETEDDWKAPKTG